MFSLRATTDHCDQLARELTLANQPTALIQRSKHTRGGPPTVPLTLLDPDGTPKTVLAIAHDQCHQCLSALPDHRTATNYEEGVFSVSRLPSALTPSAYRCPPCLHMRLWSLVITSDHFSSQSHLIWPPYFWPQMTHTYGAPISKFSALSLAFSSRPFVLRCSHARTAWYTDPILHSLRQLPLRIPTSSDRIVCAVRWPSDERPEEEDLELDSH